MSQTILIGAFAMIAMACAIALLKEKRSPAEQAALGATITAMVVSSIDSVIGISASVVIPLLSALLVGMIGSMAYRYLIERRAV